MNLCEILWQRFFFRERLRATKIVAWRDFLSVYFKCLLEVLFLLACDIKNKLFENILMELNLQNSHSWKLNHGNE
jgi:hypothetical protein